jgi:hypothetical protein
MCDPTRLFEQIDSKLFSFKMKTHQEPKAIYLGYRQWLELKEIGNKLSFRIRIDKSSPSKTGVEYSGIPVDIAVNHDPEAIAMHKANHPETYHSGEEYQIADIGMRMLSPRELFTAQGFYSDYVIDPEVNGKKDT